MKRNILPPTYFWALILLSIALHFLLPIKRLIIRPYTYLGAVIFIVGLILDLWAWAIFAREKTTLNPYKKSSKLITESIYGFSRNPQYLGMLTALIGLSTYLGSLSTFISPIIFFVASERIFIILEERNMKKRFGKRYLEYKSKVRRWI